MLKYQQNLVRRDRQEAIERLMAAGFSRAGAELEVTIQLGKFQGDVFTLDEHGNEVPLPPPDGHTSQWLWPREEG